MSKLKKIVYIGDDDELDEKIQKMNDKYLSEGYSFQKSLYEEGELIKLIVDNGANIVFVDFTTADLNTSQILNEILYIKRIERYKGVLFVAIINEVSYKDELAFLFSSGIQFSFVKGDELDEMFCDCLNIGLGENIKHQKYATAKGINKKLEIGACASYSYLTSEKIWVETDVNLEDEKVKIDFNLFDGVETKEFELASESKKSERFYMGERIDLNFPIANPWDNEIEDSIQQETIETWIQLNKIESIKKEVQVLLVTDNLSIARDLYKFSMSGQMKLSISESFEVDKIKNQIIDNQFSMIFIELKNEEEIDKLDDLFSVINSVDNYSPIVILSNTTTKSDAFSKVYDYETIMAYPTRLPNNAFEIMIESFLKKRGESAVSEDDCFTFAVGDPRRGTTILLDSMVTTMSEHEITFVSPVELPYFSVLNLKLPIECFLTVVPSIGELEYHSHGKHYIGIIHGISEKEKQKLRKFVNQMIYKPISEFTKEAVEDFVEQKAEKVVPLIKPEKEEEIEEKIDDTFQRFQIKGKSRL